MSQFNENLRAIMKDRGISQKWLAEHSGLTEATISRYMNHVNVPSADNVKKIADALGVRADDLLGKSAAGEDQESTLLIKCFRRASSRDKDLIWAVLKEYMSPEEEAIFLPLASESKRKSM